MNEVNKPKKPMIYYYAIVLLVMMLVNLFMIPAIHRAEVKEVDYGTFMKATEAQQIKEVEIDTTQNQIIYTLNDDEDQIYKTGLMDDPGLTERLYSSGAVFKTEIHEQASPLVSFLLTWVLPVVFFYAIGQLLMRRYMNKEGGGSSLMFNMGKSNARVYIKSTTGILFKDVAGEDEAKESLQEIVTYLHDPAPVWVPEFRKASCWWGLREPARPCWRKPWPENPTCRSSRSADRNLSKCLSVWAHPRCVTCSVRQKKKHRASSSLMKSMRSAENGQAAISAEMMSGNRPSISCSPKWTALKAITVW